MRPEANDPTRSGPPVPDTGGSEILLSRNEIAALGAKAARGAGMEWGLAEEAGFAAGWLSANGVDGAGALLDHLEAARGTGWAQICPVVARGAWRAAGTDPLCPVALGATLCDFAGLPGGLTDGEGILAGPVSRPVLLLPFLADIARKATRPVAIAWPGGRVIVGEGGEVAGPVADLAGLPEAALELAFAPAPSGWPARAGQTPTHRSTMAALTTLAMKTTVPASAASRDGAGAGATDND